MKINSGKEWKIISNFKALIYYAMFVRIILCAFIFIYIITTEYRDVYNNSQVRFCDEKYQYVFPD